MLSTSGFIPDRQLPYPKYYGIKFKKQKDIEFLSHLTIGGGVFMLDDYVNNIKVYLNPVDDTFDKSKMILLEKTNSVADSIISNIMLNSPIQITGDSFSIVLELSSDNYEDIQFFSSFDENLKMNSGHIYSAFSFNEEWKLESYDFPIFVFTTDEIITDISLGKMPKKNNI